MDIEGALDAISHCQKQIDYWQAQQIRALGDYAELTWQDEFASSEIAAMMHWTRNWTEDRIAVCHVSDVARSRPDSDDLSPTCCRTRGRD